MIDGINNYIPSWVSIGQTKELIEELYKQGGLKELSLANSEIALSFVDGTFGAISNRCNHMRGPLSRGNISANGYIECPWHYWKFHYQTGQALNSACEPLALSGGSVPSYNLKVENGILYIDLQHKTERISPVFNPEMPGHSLLREPVRYSGKIRVLGLSTTAMDKNHPRYSTSEDLLKFSLKQAQAQLDVETRFIALSDLNFRHCEGFYSKSEKACSWPCSITKLDPQDQMAQIYEALVFWADVVLIATPIRWGSASSLYYKMVERLNSVQNQIPVKNKVLIKNKVASFIITGGQDNIQAVSGQMLSFFGELGFVSPPFPFVGHSLGWSAEAMEHNTDFVRDNQSLHIESFELLKRSVQLAQKLL